MQYKQLTIERSFLIEANLQLPEVIEEIWREERNVRTVTYATISAQHFDDQTFVPLLMPITRNFRIGVIFRGFLVDIPEILCSECIQLSILAIFNSRLLKKHLVCQHHVDIYLEKSSGNMWIKLVEIRH